MKQFKEYKSFFEKNKCLRSKKINVGRNFTLSKKIGLEDEMAEDFNERGITLIALVVTVVVLIILAGVAVSVLTRG